MKKLICVLLLVVMLMSLLAACAGEEFTCDICQKTKNGKSYTENVAGTRITYCEDCKGAITSVLGG